jgi:hypothetical protein
LIPNFPPTPGPIVGNNSAEELDEGGLVEVVALADLNGAGGGVAMPLVDEVVRVRGYGIVDEDVEVVFGAQKRGDVAAGVGEVRPVGALDGFFDVAGGARAALRAGLVDERADAGGGFGLVGRERGDVGGDAGVGGGHY